MPAARPDRPFPAGSLAGHLVRSVARPLLVAGIVGATLLAVAPGRASALEPPRPLPGHRAQFVTETDERPWRDCLWASAAMLLDKWTNGDVRVTHQRLRRLSGDREGGSSLEDLRVAFRRLGFTVTLDGDGNATMAWGTLLARLRSGGGAVVLGDYGDLPRWYGRWDTRFWRGKGTSGNDNHAVYVERYDARRGVVWLMDPLGRGDYAGEWLPIWALHRYAWFKGGRVQAVATPTARPAPFAGVRVGHGSVALSASAVTATWPLRAPRRWQFRGADVHPSVDVAPDPVLAAALTAAAGATTDYGPPPEPARAWMRDRSLQASAALPATPGAWTAELRLTDRRLGRTVARSTPVTAFVPGPRRATVRLQPEEDAPAAGGIVAVDVRLANGGDEAWGVPLRTEATERTRRPRPTRVVATWLRLDTTHEPRREDGPDPATARAADPDRFEVELGRVSLDPGRSTRLGVDLVVPGTPGRWALVVDLVNDLDGSYAALGSRPGVALFDVQAPANGLEDDPARE
jgi:hypothetical protein